MTARLVALSIDAHDPAYLAQFWSGVLDRTVDDDGVTLLPENDTGFPIRFNADDASRVGPLQFHFDLTSSSWQEQAQSVDRALSLGGRHLDIGQGPDAEHVVLADPEDNEFCVIEPGNNFLAGCGRLGALAGDGSARTGRFWSEALDWPLVWDQDEETAIQSPGGGTKITWGGPPLNPKTGKERIHLDLAPPAGTDHQAAIDRLLSLGATRADIGQGDVEWAVLADPDGHEFCLLTPR